MGTRFTVYAHEPNVFVYVARKSNLYVQVELYIVGLKNKSTI